MILKTEYDAEGRAFYMTVDGDVADHIAYRRYGRTLESSEWLYLNNPGLAELGPVLDANHKIFLPEIPDPPTPEMVTLWT